MKFHTKSEPFGRGWVSCADGGREKRAASGLLCWARETQGLAIDPDLGLCKAYQTDATGCLNFAPVYCDAEKMEQLIGQNPQDADELRLIRDRMLPALQHQDVAGSFSAEELTHLREAHLWGGTWCGHANPDFGAFANRGTAYYREKTERCRRNNPGRDDFYDAMLLTLDAVDVLGARFHDLAEELLASGRLTASQQAKVRRIAQTFTHAPQQPCRDFCEGVIVFSLIFTFDGSSPDSPGAFDQYFGDLWDVTDPVLRRETLEDLWQFFHQTRTWNLTIGGSDEQGGDLTRDLTYAVLDVTAKYAYHTPNLTMRVHPGTPAPLLDAAFRAIAGGCGMPTLYNDTVVCPALEALGIPPQDAHRYVLNGCNQIDIMGKSHMGLEDGEVCLAKAVELALHNGISGVSGNRLGPATGDPVQFRDFDAFYSAFLTQLDHLTDIAVSMSNKAQALYARTSAEPLRSLLIEGCLEKGRDYKDGGPLYGHGQILAEAIADAVDALYVIQKYVYEDGTISMRTLLDAVNADFDGYDALYRTVTGTPYKFGNDIPQVDALAAKIVNHFNRRLQTIPTVRGGVFSGGCSPYNRAPTYGRALGTLPNGHKRCAPLIADSIGAEPGADVRGPTALLNSCLAFDHRLAGSGFILNIKFDKTVFRTQTGKDAFFALLRSYFDRGGQQLSVSVVSADDLRDAQIHPERHANLIVRVGGYSEYFTALPKDLQDNVIARTLF